MPKAKSGRPYRRPNQCAVCLFFAVVAFIAAVSLVFTSMIDRQKVEESLRSALSGQRQDPTNVPGLSTSVGGNTYSASPPTMASLSQQGYNQKAQTTDRNPHDQQQQGEHKRHHHEEAPHFPTTPFITRPESGEIHFIHIPKCGGTTMTAILRQMQCDADPSRNVDCCTNPGFCDWHAKRRCSTIKGCINHFPQRKFIFKPMPSIAIMREPVSRLLSAFFYRGHSPNLDFFQVRPYFKDIKDGKLPKVSFEEYIEMVEYQNIQTRMLGADSFPYRNVTITDMIFGRAINAVNHLAFVGLQEEFEVSVHLLMRLMNNNSSSSGLSDLAVRGGSSIEKVQILNEREQKGNNEISQQKKALRENAAVMERARFVNGFDRQLYEIGVERFCAMLWHFPDLHEQVTARGKVVCPTRR